MFLATLSKKSSRTGLPPAEKKSVIIRENFFENLSFYEISIISPGG